MKQDIEIYKAVDWTLKNDQDAGLIDVLKALNNFGHEPGINKFDLLEQIQIAIEQIECYVTERNDLQLINNLCKDFFNL